MVKLIPYDLTCLHAIDRRNGGIAIFPVTETRNILLAYMIQHHMSSIAPPYYTAQPPRVDLTFGIGVVTGSRVLAQAIRMRDQVHFCSFPALGQRIGDLLFRDAN